MVLIGEESLDSTTGEDKTQINNQPILLGEEETEEGLVEKLGTPCTMAKRFKVYMGNGQYLLCDKMCSQVPLILHGHEFCIDLYVLPIWGLDVVLRMQWLRMLGPCLQDHEALTMEFQYKGQQICLSENKVPISGSISYQRMCVLICRETIHTIYTLVEARKEVSESIIDSQIALNNESRMISEEGKELLEKYQQVFDQPHSLPPRRPMDHRIHLLPRTTPVNVRPYRYPHFQKDAMEKIVQELLDCVCPTQHQSIFLTGAAG